MHIVHLNLEREWRGGERQTLLLARELSRTSVQQTIICRKKSPLELRSRELANLNIVPVANRLQAFRALRGQPGKQIIHAHTGNTIPLAVLGSKKSVKSVITRRVSLSPRPYLLNRADAIVAISNHVKQVIVDAGVDSDLVRLIHSGVDTVIETESADPNTLKKQLNIPTDAPVILSIGALVVEKGMLTTVNALSRLEGCHAIIVGDGPLRADIDALVQKLNIRDRVHLIGFDPSPNSWFKAADVFVLPSLHEGLGTAYLDAFLHETPVVGSDIPGTADVLIEGKTALRALPENPESLALAIKRILSEPKIRSELIRNGSAHARIFDVRIMAESYLNLYRELLPSRSAGMATQASI